MVCTVRQKENTSKTKIIILKLVSSDQKGNPAMSSVVTADGSRAVCTYLTHSREDSSTFTAEPEKDCCATAAILKTALLQVTRLEST